MNEPQAHLFIRLIAFHTPAKNAASRRSPSSRTVEPPARHPPSIAAAASAKSSLLGRESASMNTSHSPPAARIPALRAREIWFTGSKTTRAPAARAISAVPSLELLSQTTSSHAQPRASNAAAAARMLARDAASSPSSLNAGTITETFIFYCCACGPRTSRPGSSPVAAPSR